MNTYFFVTHVPENTSLPQYFSGIATNLWPVGLGILILLLMEAMHQLNLIRIAAQDRAYTSGAPATPTPTTPILRAEPAGHTASTSPFSKKPKEEKAPVYFAINTPPPAERPKPAPHVEQDEQEPDTPAESDTQDEPETSEQQELPERPKDPTLSFFKLD